MCQQKDTPTWRDHRRAEGTTSVSVHFKYISKTSNNQRKINLHAGERAPFLTVKVFWLGIQFRQRYGQIKDRMPNIFWIFLAWHDPETPGVQELILSLFKVHSWLTYGWKSVRFWWYFHTFHENGDEVMLKIRLKTPTKIILEAVLFMYLLTNTNIAGIQFFLWPNMLLSCWL